MTREVQRDLYTITPHEWRRMSDAEKRGWLTLARSHLKRIQEIVNFMERNPPKPARSAFPIKRSS